VDWVRKHSPRSREYRRGRDYARMLARVCVLNRVVVQVQLSRVVRVVGEIVVGQEGQWPTGEKGRQPIGLRGPLL